MRKPNFHQNEQGSAILIVLGILTLVLVLALVFVATSRNARAIATAGADYEKAGLIAESAAARAQAVSYYTQSVLVDNIPPDGDVNELVYDHQPYAGSFVVDEKLTHSASAASGTEKFRLVRVQHLKGRKWPTGTSQDVNQNGSVLYTHDKNNKSADHVLYSLFDSTQYGKYLDYSTYNFKDRLSQANYNSNFTYQNILDEDGHVQSRYAFLMIPEGPKFNVNRMVLAGGDGVNDIPFVQSGELANPANFDPNDFTGVDSLQDDGRSYFAITGYEYNDSGDPGKITGLKNNGAYDEGVTLQYGLHPQELRISENVKDLADKLELNDDNNPPQWFNFENLLAINKSLWDKNPGKQLLSFWSLYTTASGLDDREVLYHGDETNIEECSNDSPKINLAYPMHTSWDTISATLSSILESGTVSMADYLANPSNFQDIFGDALASDTDNYVLFKDNDGDITAKVFANLVDFCDSDSIVTYEATVGTGAAAQRLKFDTAENDISNVDIKICGNEKTPAVIGVGLELTNCDRTITNSTVSGQQVWNSSGSGVTDARVRVVLQNYFNDPVDLPKQVRVVIRGKANPWCAGFRTDAGGTTYWLYDRTTSQPISSYGTSNDELDAVLAGIDFSAHAKEFVVDQTVSLSGSLNAREVDDTSINIELNPAFDAQCSQANNVLGKIERSGYWLKVTDILVMTADEITDPNTSLPTTKVMDLVYADGDDHTILWRRNDRNLAWSGNHLVAWAAAQDPRCNHRDWKWFNDSVSGVSGWNWSTNSDNGYVTIGLIKNGSFGIQDKLRKAALALIQSYCKNTSFATGGGSTPVTYATKDLEPELNLIVSALNAVAQTPNTFSTAFIPNAPITSLWQLGAVSRALPAQTINLKKYGGPKGDLKYEDGDAWLLDYFKLNELKAESPFPGKFNPNCFYALAYRYLFANIPANPDPNDTAVYQPGRLNMSDIKRNKFYYDMIKQGGTPIELEYAWTGAQAPSYWDTHSFRGGTGLFAFNPILNFENTQNDANLAPGYADNQSWSPVEAFFNFVVIMNTPKYKTGDTTVGANDRMAESLIGCTAGLLSTRYEYFTVFAIGQSLKYIGQTHTNTRDDYLPVIPVKPEATYVPGTHQGKDFYNQLVNPVKIKASATEEGWYSVLSTQMRLMTIERDCWFNTMRVVRTQLY